MAEQDNIRHDRNVIGRVKDGVPLGVPDDQIVVRLNETDLRILLWLICEKFPEGIPASEHAKYAMYTLQKLGKTMKQVADHSHHLGGRLAVAVEMLEAQTRPKEPRALRSESRDRQGRLKS